MSEEFSNGVKIILSRVESHPDEFVGEFSPWRIVVNSVLNKKAGGTAPDIPFLRALTGAEIDALHEAFLPIARQEFDEWVMKQVFNGGKPETSWDEVAQSPYTVQPHLFAQGRVAERAQLRPGVTISHVGTSNTSIASKLKQKLGI